MYLQCQGGKTYGAIEEAIRSSKAIDKRVIINFYDKNTVIAVFTTKMFFIFMTKCLDMSCYIMMCHDLSCYVMKNHDIILTKM